jgi:hypothetical protein
VRHIRRLLELGWRAVTEAHTALWVIEMIVTPTVLTAVLAWFFEHSPAVIGGFFLLALAATVLVTLALLGHWRETHPVSIHLPANDQTEWTISELFFHICPDLERDKENAALRRNTAKAVLDELSSGTIKMRGRKIDRPATKRLPLAWIEADYWPHVLLTYWFLDREESVLDARNEKTGVEYADLRIDRAAALKVWPPPIPLREAAGKAYERTRGTEMSQAAEAHSVEPDGILNHYITALFAYMRIVAQKPPSTVYEEIPTFEKPSLRLWPQGETMAIGYHASRVVTYLDPRIHLADLEAFIEDAKETPEQKSRF